jgi:hypothetical protein
MGENDWLVTGNAVKADIHSLHTFAEALRTELKDHLAASMKNGITPLAAAAAPFGAGKLPEGAFFRTQHINNVNAIHDLLAAVQKGIMALAVAADSIAWEYGDADATSKATYDEVLGLFTPKAGDTTLADLAAQAEAEGNGNATTNGYNNPTNIPENAGQNATAGIPAGDPKVISPGTGYAVDITDNEGVHDPTVDPSRYQVPTDQVPGK